MALFQRCLLYIAANRENKSFYLGEKRKQSERRLQSGQYYTYIDWYLRNGKNISIYKNGSNSHFFTFHLYFEWDDPNTADAHLSIVSDIFQEKTSDKPEHQTDLLYSIRRGYTWAENLIAFSLLFTNLITIYGWDADKDLIVSNILQGQAIGLIILATGIDLLLKLAKMCNQSEPLV